ncbi:MAG: anthranilate synthase component I family protein [Phycisphaerales bacterium]|nr:anthranilate synthase component I family protein [Phycisphaerales bacterium]
MSPTATDLWTCARNLPCGQPVALLQSAGRGRWSSHSICAPATGMLRIERSGASWIGPKSHPAGTPPVDPLEALDWAHEARRFATAVEGCPAAGGWIAVLSYELGELLDTAVVDGPPPSDDRNAPLADLLWCPDPIVCLTQDEAQQDDTDLHREAVISEPPPEDHVEAVRRTVELIRAGDIFQANIARRLTMCVEGDPMAWSRRAIQEACAPFGAMIRLPHRDGDRVITSMSPELFVHVSESGVITSRPIKGTAGASTATDALAQSEKDQAELHMIVDLVRNDLGRICAMGSVDVIKARSLETHSTVHHGVAEVRGQLKDGVGLVELLRATFPPGSVTGAPKIRAMQIIRQLETRPRGAYCGAIGLLGPRQATMLSVGIRTATLHGRLDGHMFSGTLDYGTGGGITAQSDPDLELAETCIKAEALERSFRRSDADLRPADHAAHEVAAVKPYAGAADSR